MTLNVTSLLKIIFLKNNWLAEEMRGWYLYPFTPRVMLTQLMASNFKQLHLCFSVAGNINLSVSGIVARTPYYNK
jgi:hypothetical protein